MLWSIMSKLLFMSPSINQSISFHCPTSFSAVCVLLFGLKPCELLRNIDSSYIDSSIIAITFCTILSLGDGIPSGLIFPFAFGIHSFLEGLNLKV